MAITIKDIAKQVGVSPSVVSRALNNKYGVKETTREAILNTAREMDYYPNVIARSLVTRKTKTIGVMMGDISESFYSMIIKGMEFVAQTAGYTLLFSNSYDQLDHGDVLKKMVHGAKADGLVIVGSNIKDEHFFLNLAEQEIPFVLLERNLAHPKINCIWVDNFTGGYLATQYLTGKNHRRIAHLAGPLHFQSALDRLEGYKKALAEAGLPFDKELVISGDFYWKTGHGATREILRRSPECNAIFAANDTMAFGALQAIKEAGLKVPDDITVVGYDDIEFSALMNPTLTTIRQPRFEMGKLAVSNLLSTLESGESSGNNKICFTPELIVRGSA
jgi:DNA-binding LacI/PurR family transcriptional regulator